MRTFFFISLDDSRHSDRIGVPQDVCRKRVPAQHHPIVFLTIPISFSGSKGLAMNAMASFTA